MKNITLILFLLSVGGTSSARATWYLTNLENPGRTMSYLINPTFPQSYRFAPTSNTISVLVGSHEIKLSTAPKIITPSIASSDAQSATPSNPYALAINNGSTNLATKPFQLIKQGDRWVLKSQP